MASSKTIIVFAKAPIPGEVKTRLTPFLTAEKAAALHRKLVEHTLQTVSSVSDCKVELWVGSQHSWWSVLTGQYDLVVFEQCGEDLGARMLFAVNDALQRSDQVLIVGTDSPAISADYIQTAFTGLEQEDIVIGPADDGGYVMLGLRRSLPCLFGNMPWGSDGVYAATVARLRADNLSWCEMPSLMDIDRPEDFLALSQLKPELTQGLIE